MIQILSQLLVLNRQQLKINSINFNYRAEVSQTFFGANIIIAIPVIATTDPTISQTVGFIPSIPHNQRIATNI